MNDHLVQFYEDDVFLIKGLADYIGAALASGSKGIDQLIRSLLQ